MVKKYTSIILLTLLAIHLAGFYVYFIVRMSDVRMSMREELETLPASQLTVVQIPADQFRPSWLAAREMKWMGTMYDIARVQQKGDLVIVLCIPDKDEENLLNFISAVIDMGSRDTRPAPLTLTQFFALKFIASAVFCPPLSTTKLKVLQTRYLLNAMSVTTIPATPPPRG